MRPSCDSSLSRTPFARSNGVIASILIEMTRFILVIWDPRRALESIQPFLDRLRMALKGMPHSISRMARWIQCFGLSNPPMDLHKSLESTMYATDVNECDIGFILFDGAEMLQIFL